MKHPELEVLIDKLTGEKCTCDEGVIASYHEGRLTGVKKKAFERHLCSCPKCLGAWLGLEEDMKKMGGPAGLSELTGTPTLTGFTLLVKKTGLEMLKVTENFSWTPILAPAMRGQKPEAKLQTGVLTKKKMCGLSAVLSLELAETGRVRVAVRFSTRNPVSKLVGLYREGREVLSKITALHPGDGPTLVVLGSVQKGSYTIRIGALDLFAFRIEQER